MDRGRTSRTVRTNRVAAAAGPDAAHTIVSVSDLDGSDVRVVTAAPHGLVGSETVVIRGTSVAGYNGQSGSVTVDDAITFILPIAYTAAATGGSWRPQ